ncbi:MAG: DivIVA domain-containing protein [bacterium]
MKITPVELKNIEFKKTMHGFDPKEVTSCIESVAQTFEELIIEKNNLVEELKKYKQKAQYQENISNEIQDMLNKAKEEANSILEMANSEKQAILAEISSLKNEHSEFIAQFKFLLNSYMLTIDKMVNKEQI